MADEAWAEHYYGQQPPHPTCLETTALAGVTSYVCGPDCPKPKPAGPDPERDKRIDLYRDRERRRAARALDRYIDLVVKGDGEDVAAARVAGERLVEACGDYVLARLTKPQLAALRSAIDYPEDVYGWEPTENGVRPLVYGASPLQHKSHYGVPVDTEDATVLPSSLHQDDGGK